jgi:hypothetical protein
MVKGMVAHGIAALYIDEALPKSKAGMMPEVHERWLELIHGAIADLAAKTEVPKFHKAMVGIHITTEAGGKSRQLWDTSNRAINLVINNLKGVFFPDDNFQHMAFAVVGDIGEKAETKIYIGDFESQAVDVVRLLGGLNLG